MLLSDPPLIVMCHVRSRRPDRKTDAPLNHARDSLTAPRSSDGGGASRQVRQGTISARSATTPLTLLAHLRRLERLAFPITLTSAIMIAKLP